MRDERVNRRTLAVTFLTAIMVIATMASMATAGNVFAYNRNQATGASNDCGDGQEPTNIGCQNADSQIQGDENSAALTSQQTFPSVTTAPETPEPSTTGTLKVIKEATCSAGIRECPGTGDYRFRVFINNGQDPAFSFPGSSTGTTREIEGGSTYEVEEVHPELLPGQILKTTFSPHCSGTIEAGESLICTFTNEIFLAG